MKNLKQVLKGCGRTLKASLLGLAIASCNPEVPLYDYLAYVDFNRDGRQDRVTGEFIEEQSTQGKKYRLNGELADFCGNYPSKSELTTLLTKPIPSSMSWTEKDGMTYLQYGMQVALDTGNWVYTKLTKFDSEMKNLGTTTLSKVQVN